MIAHRKVFAVRNSGLKVFAAVTLALTAAGVQAEPYIAMRTGFKCSQCHVNRIGGGERTEYGSVYTQYKLLMVQTHDLMEAAQGGQSSLNPKLNDAVTIGGNFRVEETATQKYTYTDNTGAHVVTENNQANIKEANLYINVELIKNFLNLYTDETVAPTTSVREMYGMVRNLPLNGYVKVGHTLLPYGIRLMDDQAFIRQMTGYTYNRHDLAGEVGIEPGPFSLTTNLTNNQSSSVGSIVFRHFRLGGSYGSSTIKAHEYTYGPFAGANFGRVTMMGEVDLIHHAVTPDTSQMAEFLELDFLPIQGCNVKGTYEYFDRDLGVAMKHNGQDRWTFGVEPFISRFLQLGLYYRINRAVPQDIPDNQDQLIMRAHVFF